MKTILEKSRYLAIIGIVSLLVAALAAGEADVVVAAVIPCGDCKPCAAGRGNMCARQFMPGNDGDGGFATLLFDLLTPSEEAIDARTAQLRFNVEMLAQRLVGAIDWLAEQPDAGDRLHQLRLPGVQTLDGTLLQAHDVTLHLLDRLPAHLDRL